MGIRTTATIAAVAATILLAATNASVAAAALPDAPDYVVATFSFEEHFVAAAIPSVDVALCVPPPQAFGCFTGGGLPLLLFPSLTTPGMTVWVDANSPNFSVIAGALTNGQPDLIAWGVFPAGDFGGGAGVVGVPEQDLLDGQVGPSGVDLAGYRIDRIGLHVGSISFASAASTISGTFVFEGTIASTSACKNGGWQSLHGPAGVQFKNEGQCIRLVETSR
jgi:hypothetical protein